MKVVMKRATLLLTMLLAAMSMSAATFANEGKSFEKLDKDGDQNISQQELDDAGKNVDMNQLDSDSDGVISKEEYEKAKSMWKDKKRQ